MNPVSQVSHLFSFKGLKQEFCVGWKPFELIWLGIFLITQIVVFYFDDPSNISTLSVIAGLSGIICNVFVSKGKISNFLFGLIFAYSYFYASWQSRYYGEMTSSLFIYIPAQFIGYFLWQQNMQKQTDASELVQAKTLTIQGWVALIAGVVIGTVIFYSILLQTDGKSIGLDGLSTVLVVAAQLLMVLRYNEQWLLWILVNLISIALWRDNSTMVVMYIAYLLNAIYGYWNWHQLSKATSAHHSNGINNV